MYWYKPKAMCREMVMKASHVYIIVVVKAKSHLLVNMSHIVVIHSNLFIRVVWWFSQWSLKDH